jgi:phosphohistidine phosphatase
MTANQLILIRHATAEAHGADDAQRRLAPRGERDARAVGRWLRAAGVTTGVALVSPATRAAQTWALALEELGGGPSTVTEERIYDNTVDDLLEVIRSAPAQTGTLILVGHNPAIAELATVLHDGAGDPSAAREVASSFPTSGIAVLSVRGPWSGLAPGGASLLSFAVPRGDAAPAE